MDSSYDPRSDYAAALAWVTGLMRDVRADQRDAPTPCTEFDVHTLMEHLIATAVRAEAIGHGRDANAEPRFVESDDPATTYAETADRAIAAWTDDATLDAPASVPWGTVPGRAALAGYVRETLVHGWDLAVATGQPAEADPAVVAPALATAQEFLPAEIRAEEWVPFDPPVEPRADAGPTERLANWCGHTATGLS